MQKSNREILVNYSIYTLMISIILILIGLATIQSSRGMGEVYYQAGIVDISGTLTQLMTGFSLVFIGSILLLISFWYRLKSLE